MGIFDKLKQAANFVTGGGAKVRIQTAEGVLDGTQPISIIIHADIKDSPITIEKVYLRIRVREYIYLQSADIYMEDGTFVQKPIHQENVYYRHEQEVSGPQELAANESYSWATEIVLPEDMQGSYQGQWCKHEIAVEAALDAKGNDPDSGWQALRVMK